MKRLVSILGDSISTFAGCNPPGYAVFYEGERAAATGVTDAGATWWARLAHHMGAEIVANASFSGSLVEGAGFPAGESPERARALATPHQMPTDVLVFIGTNDYGWGGAQAQAAGRGSAVPACVDLSRVPEAQPGLAAPQALASFERAYGHMLANVRATCPQARLWCFSLMAGRLVGSAEPTFAWNLRGIPMRAYNEAIGRACATQDACTFVDAARLGFDYEALDGTHPTARGMAQLAELFAAAMEGRAPAPELLAGFASRELCPDRACVGCPHARGTGMPWSCVCERPAAQVPAAGA